MRPQPLDRQAVTHLRVEHVIPHILISPHVKRGDPGHREGCHNCGPEVGGPASHGSVGDELVPLGKASSDSCTHT